MCCSQMPKCNSWSWFYYFISSSEYEMPLSVEIVDDEESILDDYHDYGDDDGGDDDADDDSDDDECWNAGDSNTFTDSLKGM